MNWVVSESKVGTPEASLLKSDVEIAMEHLKQENAKLHAMLAQLRAESAQPVLFAQTKHTTSRDTDHDGFLLRERCRSHTY